MARLRVNRVIPTDENASPKIFAASSLLFREWLKQEVEKRTQVAVLPDQQDMPKPNVDESKPSISRKRKKC